MADIAGYPNFEIEFNNNGAAHDPTAVKQVLDPDGVNSYALWGKLQVAASGRGFETGGAVPFIINAYDEQAMDWIRRRESTGRGAGLRCPRGPARGTGHGSRNRGDRGRGLASGAAGQEALYLVGDDRLDARHLLAAV